MNNTTKQLVEQLGDNTEITIMADIVHGLDFEYEQLQQENNRLLELCMYALIRDTKIYNHELEYPTQYKFKEIIKNNLNDDTNTLREKLITAWGNE